MSPALVVGADGLIGARLLRELRAAGEDAIGTSRRATASPEMLRLDLSDPPDALLDTPALRRLRSGPPWAAYLTAGITGLEACTNDPAGTRRINVTRVATLAEALVRAGAFVVYPSSSAVFRNSATPPRESEVPAPVSEYGRQKSDAERALLDLVPRGPAAGGVAVLRLTKVVSPTGRVGRWMDTLRGGGIIEAADDLLLSPISLGFTARALIRIADARRSGAYHLSGESVMSWFDFARRLATALAADPDRVRAVPAHVTESSCPTLDMAATQGYSYLTAQPFDSTLSELRAEL